VAAAVGLWAGSRFDIAPPQADTTQAAIAQATAISVPASASPTTTRSLAEEIHDRLNMAGGCTLDPRSGRAVGSVDAYAVSLPGYEARFASCPSVQQIERYLARHAADWAENRAIYVGAWRDDATGQHCLDLSELIGDRTTAERRGRAQLQQCIYHMSTGQEIRLR
jgi:hypothetical protein